MKRLRYRPLVAIIAAGLVGPPALFASPASAMPTRHETSDSSRLQLVSMADDRIDMPDVIHGPIIDLTIRNDGHFVHELATARIAPNTTVQQLIDESVQGGSESLELSDPGGINLLGPGESVRYQRRLEPGTYFYVVEHVGGGPQLQARAYHIFRVTGGGEDELPDVERTICLADEAITIPKLRSGTRSYAIKNTGTTPHEVFIIGVDDPTNLDHGDELGAWLDGGQVGPAPFPVHFPGGQQSIGPGETVVLTMTLRAGTTYLFLDPSADPPNVAVASTHG